MDIFIPCRSGSKRIPGKNTKPFTGDGQSLLEIKLGHLLRSGISGQIILSTDDEKAALQANKISGSIFIDERPKNLAADDTKISDLAKHARSLISSQYFIWTHVTSPLFDENSYKRLVESFDQRDTEADSFVAAKMLQSYLFDEQKRPIHKDSNRSKEQWPPTQDLQPIYEVNNAAFLAPTYCLAVGERISSRWEFFECDSLESLDVDNQRDWTIAQTVIAGKTSLGL